MSSVPTAYLRLLSPQCQICFTSGWIHVISTKCLPQAVESAVPYMLYLRLNSSHQYQLFTSGCKVHSAKFALPQAEFMSSVPILFDKSHQADFHALTSNVVLPQNNFHVRSIKYAFSQAVFNILSTILFYLSCVIRTNIAVVGTWPNFMP